MKLQMSLMWLRWQSVRAENFAVVDWYCELRVEERCLFLLVLIFSAPIMDLRVLFALRRRTSGILRETLDEPIVLLCDAAHVATRGTGGDVQESRRF